MSGRRSKRKGQRGELEWARFLTDHGFRARRGRQYAGGPGSPDVVCEDLPAHWEVKRAERMNLYDALEQATREAPELAVPVVAHRRNNHPWVVVLDAAAFLEILRGSDLCGMSVETLAEAVAELGGKA